MSNKNWLLKSANTIAFLQLKTIVEEVLEDQNNSIEILRVKVLKILYKSHILIFWNETCCDSFIYSNN